MKVVDPQVENRTIVRQCQKIGRSLVASLWKTTSQCHTMYDMKSSAVTIRLDPETQRMLDKVCKETHRTRSDVLRDALKRQLTILRFEQLRRRVVPFAEAAGYLTDEDVFKAIS